MTNIRKDTDSLGVVEVPADKLWGAQTQRSLEHFSIGTDVMPREMITADAIVKKAAATANHASKRLNEAVQIDRADVRRNPRRPASRYVPVACVDDGQRPTVQYACERSDLQPRLPARGHTTRQQDTGAPQRSREYGAVVE